MWFVLQSAHALPSTPNWSVTGEPQFIYLGESATLLDTNGDGFDDVALGSYQEQAVRLYMGSETGPADTFQTISDLRYYTRFSDAMAPGDFNCDGYDDLAIGSPSSAAPGLYNSTGDLRVHLGGASGLSPVHDWEYVGTDAYGYFGTYMGSIGDVNGDGCDELTGSILSKSVGYTWTTTGWVSVFYGDPSGLGAAPDLVLTGDPEMYLGLRAEGGDVDCDGYGDLIVTGDGSGATMHYYEGVVRAYRGGPGGLETTPSWQWEADQSWANMFGITGDLNGDGCDDVITADGYGRISAYFGGVGGPSSTPDWTYNQPLVSQPTDLATGDTDGDGDEELLLGLGYISGNGELQLFYGDPSSISNSPDWTFQGAPWSYIGRVTSMRGDTNGDGFAEVFSSSYLTGDNGTAWMFWDQDSDGDNVPDDADCAPEDPSSYPGATEVFGNGVDEDCDGLDAELGIADLLPGDLVLTEVMFEPQAENDQPGQWFELEVTAPEPVDLVGLEVSLGRPITAHVLAEPGDRLVFAGNADPSLNGGVEGAFAVPDLFLERGETLSLSAGELLLIEQDLETLPFRIGSSAALVDGVWCLETAPYGDEGNFGTPGQPNSPCEAPPAEETPEDPDPVTPPAEKEGCGCGTGAPSGLLGLMLAGLLVRRRR